MKELEIIKHCAAAIFVINADHKLICWNKACEELTGIKAAEVLGTNQHWRAFYKTPRPCLCDYIVDGGTEPVVGQYLIFGKSTLLAGGWHAESWFANLGGKRRYIIFDATPIYDYEGKIEMVVQTIEDITDHRKSEEALANLARNLEQKNKELNAFNRIVSHDLKEPLTLIQLLSEKLHNKCSTFNDDTCKEYVNHISSAASRMQDLITGLLECARVNTQAQPFAPVNLAQTVDEVLADLEARIEETKGTIHLENLETIEADPIQMHQLFMNLISNALKYHPPNVAPQVRVSSKIIEDPAENAQFCQISVEDNGIGFQDKDKWLIFEAFHRLHSRKDYDGAGIGLSICKKIVARHGGDIRAESVPGKGAIFIITLPLHQK